MSKNDEIYDTIVDHSLRLFNTKGIHQTSIQDIMNDTDLPKGAIYRRFENKNDIVLASYEKAGKIIWKHMQDAIKNKTSAYDKIMAISEIYLDAVHNPPIEGGCPMLNTAIESDGTFPELKSMMSKAFQQMITYIESILIEGIENNELNQEFEPRSLASYLLSSMEGSIMTSRLSLSNEHIHYNIEHTKRLLLSYSL